MEGYGQGEGLTFLQWVAWTLIICAPEPRNTSFRVCAPLTMLRYSIFFTVTDENLQILDNLGHNRLAHTVTVVECTYSATISLHLVAV